ncbi:hypothetical protein SNA_21675 [Streptomyces natalensis ATCC 27448]|uniref:DUF317 domain-containing protein n=1 Tax=Streptomyces natalensis ATCC 27448 TaxID=1240678 RepID=A0A0D7CI65_9ACTN|nr:hypothetical protein SNA_21675 [Streptomyces natalensis ATCC 27448]
MVLGAPCLWAASFGASVPHDLVAVFAGALSSTAPVLRRVLPESTRDRLLRAPAGWASAPPPYDARSPASLAGRPGFVLCSDMRDIAASHPGART